MITICPCCGYKFSGSMFEGCPSCHSQAVGEPLARPEHELPNYGRAVMLGALGVLLLLALLVATGIAFFTRPQITWEYRDFVAAGQTAAWQLKFITLPLGLLGLAAGWQILRRIRNNPRFAGLPVAYSGVALIALVTLMMANLIGVTVPERLRQREKRLDAAVSARGYTIQRAMLEYRTRYGTLPSGLEELTKRLPDTDGSVAQALAQLPTDSYHPWSVQASAPGGKTLNGARVRPASARVGAAEAMEGLSLTNYELRLPGHDAKLGTEDDWIMRDGSLAKVAPEDKPAR